ncbi:hypothetical protein DFP73DRAFT_528131 [Morchella snyderi]|nr:hypothetical protein DFP73DRAFT_528131 [Morchella snyderi]
MPSPGNRSTRAVAGSELGTNTPAEILEVDSDLRNLPVKRRILHHPQYLIEDGVEALYIGEYGKAELERAVSNWPNVQSVSVRSIRDILRVLNSNGQDYIWHQQQYAMKRVGRFKVKAVSEYWRSTQIDIKKDSELALLSSSLKEIEQHGTTSPLFWKKLSISSTTAKDWLHRLGYHWGEVKKGVYKDGHERPDVVNYRQEVFLKTYEELASVMPYPVRHKNGDVEVDIPIVPEGHKLIIPVTHDECTCNANDGPHYQWVKGDHIYR